ncbi:hypothetical protein [Salinibacter altiplanensis]|uniref:hypothetical protein n=1 Tax=Salinibacter altiplanensis TaxID=1803181 RepID=UPI001319F338|nr:hypothetical protein [Salinibacter altiplanensis]
MNKKFSRLSNLERGNMIKRLISFNEKYPRRVKSYSEDKKGLYYKYIKKGKFNSAIDSLNEYNYGVTKRKIKGGYFKSARYHAEENGYNFESIVGSTAKNIHSRESLSKAVELIVEMYEEDQIRFEKVMQNLCENKNGCKKLGKELEKHLIKKFSKIMYQDPQKAVTDMNLNSIMQNPYKWIILGIQQKVDDDNRDINVSKEKMSNLILKDYKRGNKEFAKSMIKYNPFSYDNRILLEAISRGDMGIVKNIIKNIGSNRKIDYREVMLSLISNNEKRALEKIKKEDQIEYNTFSSNTDIEAVLTEKRSKSVHFKRDMTLAIILKMSKQSNTKRTVEVFTLDRGGRMKKAKSIRVEHTNISKEKEKKWSDIKRKIKVNIDNKYAYLKSTTDLRRGGHETYDPEDYVDFEHRRMQGDEVKKSHSIKIRSR